MADQKQAKKKKKKKSQFEKARDLVNSVLGRDGVKHDREADKWAVNEGSTPNKMKKIREERKRMLDEI
jgi:hypothetical protein